MIIGCPYFTIAVGNTASDYYFVQMRCNYQNKIQQPPLKAFCLADKALFSCVAFEICIMDVLAKTISSRVVK